MTNKMSSEEKQPLLSRDSKWVNEDTKKALQSSGIYLKKHITLSTAVSIMVGNMVGSGIFVSPKGVTQNIGSVGASLIIWTVTGLYNLAQALCYAELGTLIPKAGGDYAYIHDVLGPLPGFMCAWVQVLIVCPSSAAIIARTGSLYILQPIGVQCHQLIVTLGTVLIVALFATLNCITAKWAAKLQNIFSISKVLALSVIIVIGIIRIARGNIQNFQDSFRNTNTDPGAIALAMLDGYFAYKSWELIMTLPEEMVNPARDLPRSVWISMLLVTALYVLTNVAYFAVLTPAELLSSDAVALSFADRTLGMVSWIISIFVALSCMGTVNGSFLSNSRYLFAGGRFRQMPQIVSMIHVKLFTPMPAVMALFAIAAVYCLFTDIKSLQEYTSLAVQLKVLLAFIALFYLRWKKPKLHRPVKVNIVVVAVTFLALIGLVALSFLQSPIVTGVGLLIFVSGIPVYFLMKLLRASSTATRIDDVITRVFQQLLLVVPEKRKKNEGKL